MQESVYANVAIERRNETHFLDELVYFNKLFIKGCTISVVVFKGLQELCHCTISTAILFIIIAVGVGEIIPIIVVRVCATYKFQRGKWGGREVCVCVGGGGGKE